MSTISALSLRRASFGYAGRTIINDLSLNFHGGGVTAILGSNGSGKSTLLKGMLGLADCLGGEVRLGEASLLSMDAGARSRTLAYLEQQADCHWPMPVKNVVQLGRFPYRRHELSAQDQDAIANAMAIADVNGLAERPVSQLSGGERTRVMLARALAVDAPVLFADEPVAGLDPQHQISVLKQLQAWSQQDRIVLVVLHDLNLALRYCDNAVLLTPHGGVLHGAASDIINEENVRHTFGIRTLQGRHQGLPYILPWDIEP